MAVSNFMLVLKKQHASIGKAKWRFLLRSPAKDLEDLEAKVDLHIETLAARAPGWTTEAPDARHARRCQQSSPQGVCLPSIWVRPQEKNIYPVVMNSFIASKGK